MLPNNRRRHLYLAGNERRKSRVIGRLVFGVIAILITWYLATRVFALFDHAVGHRSPTILSIRPGTEGYQVSLQSGQWQNAENNLKLYPGDSVAAHGNADLVLSFFDGTRLRLDQGSELTIDQSDSYGQNGDSRIDLTLKAGRAWVSTPSVQAYSGSIARIISLPSYQALIPANTNALFADSQLTVLRATDLGIKVTLTFPKSSSQILYIGEGQFLSLSEEARRDIGNGTDPYEHRDPISAQVLKDDFLIGSYSLLSSSSLPGAEQPTAISVSPLPGQDQNLKLTSPENHAVVPTKTVTVSGQVSPRIVTLLVNGQSVPIKKDLTFSVDISLTKDPTTAIKVEAQDIQGITLDESSLTVTNAYKPVVNPVRIKSPVGSGETLVTALSEVEITGEATPGTAGVIINDYRLQLFKPGDKTWSYLASAALGNLVPGLNVFTVTAVDADDNRSPPRSLTIVYQPNAATGTGVTAQPPIKQNPPLTPGVLIVDTPAAGASTETAEKEVVIAGRTSADTYSISVNGYTLSLYLPGKTTWNYIASTDLSTMKRGKNVYRIVARNQSGEILDILEYTITYKP